MTASFIVADVFGGLATIPDGSVDLVVTSPPFLALRSYLPADHPDKSKEIGSEATPAEFIDVVLRVTQELRRVLAPHGSICVELGDTYAGSGGENHLYEGSNPDGGFNGSRDFGTLPTPKRGSTGWPLSKSRTLIPQLYEIALAYGINPLTGQPSPAGQWRIRNVVTWARPNPPVGALGDKWRPATSDLIVACVSPKRYWDDLATRRPLTSWRANTSDGLSEGERTGRVRMTDTGGSRNDDGAQVAGGAHPSGAPLLDYWEIPPGGYKGSHYAVFPDELVVPCVQAMCPPKVCRTCGEPSRRVVGEATYEAARQAFTDETMPGSGFRDAGLTRGMSGTKAPAWKSQDTLGWSDCGHDNWRPGLILDPFAGSGTTLAVATGHGHDAIGIDLDVRNAELARERIGPFFFEELQQ